MMPETGGFDKNGEGFLAFAAFDKLNGDNGDEQREV